MTPLEKSIGRLNAALERLVIGKPNLVKAKGKLTLNKINNEAGFGKSYIHNKRFADWVKKTAKPAIKKFEIEYDPLKLELESGKEELSEIEKLKSKLKKERELKTKYRNELSEAIEKEKIAKKLVNDLMFRVYELQNEKQISNVVCISKSTS
ncbi:hypothetical protein L1D46_01145 [Pseudoalteromonas sp. Isolate3]|uniref:hypothetical protein n=1 Tax=Pseudoalteromonas sp. Isolate3 TaxID=2908526 RepID=UPI001EFC925B|nr:hypothetical protein [Pseudoalteromonas sp. Isolate3]MCG9707416.1 hypothetical protein [Pseudoalteromonas sp. Isolate3]